MVGISVSELIDLHRKAKPGREPEALMAVFGFLFVYLLLSPAVDTLAWALALIGVGIGVISYFVRQRKNSRRANQYSPLKKDKEVQPSKFSWRREGLFIIMVVPLYLLVAFQPSFELSYAVALIPALIFGAWAFFSTFIAGRGWPAGYTSPETLFSNHVDHGNTPELTFNGADAAVAILHAQLLVPGAFQRTRETIVNELAAAGYDRDLLDESFTEAIAEGRIVQVGEIRSNGTNRQWLNLTDAAMTDFQQHFETYGANTIAETA